MAKSQKISANKHQPIVAANRNVNANYNNTSSHLVRSSSATFLSQAYPPSQTQTQTQTQQQIQSQTANSISGTATP